MNRDDLINALRSVPFFLAVERNASAICQTIDSIKQENAELTKRIAKQESELVALRLEMAQFRRTVMQQL